MKTANPNPLARYGRLNSSQYGVPIYYVYTVPARLYWRSVIIAVGVFQKISKNDLFKVCCNMPPQSITSRPSAQYDAQMTPILTAILTANLTRVANDKDYN